ncbi:MAG TPA: response regulator transcription factor [Nitriliruptorales bacterium]
MTYRTHNTTPPLPARDLPRDLLRHRPRHRWRGAAEERGPWTLAAPAAVRVGVREQAPLARAGLEALIAAAPSLELVPLSPLGPLGPLDPPGVEGKVDALVVGIGGLDLADGPDHPVTIVVAPAFTDAQVFDLLRAGFAGLLLHGSAPDLLEPAVRSAVGGGRFVDPHLVPRLVAMAARGGRTGGPGELTIQELRVLGLVARGLTNRQIGGELGLSPHTVKAHLHGAMGKLGAADRHQAVEQARARGLAGWDE